MREEDVIRTRWVSVCGNAAQPTAFAKTYLQDTELSLNLLHELIGFRRKIWPMKLIEILRIWAAAVEQDSHQDTFQQSLSQMEWERLPVDFTKDGGTTLREKAKVVLALAILQHLFTGIEKKRWFVALHVDDP